MMTFSQLLAAQQTLQAPAAYDALSARIIEQTGFSLVYLSGLGNEASDLGFPDVGLTTVTELVRRASNIVQCVDVPVVCDADTGFGGKVNVARTVRLFEAAGVSAIHLEDQTFPKRCGLLEGKQVVPAAAFADAIKGALDARRGDSFGIIARTDAKHAEGIDGVIERLQCYAEQGVDALMLGDFYTLDEYRRIASAVPVPLVACAADPDHFDTQPDHALGAWQNAGVSMVVYWHLALFAALAAVEDAVNTLKRTGATSGARQVAGYRDYGRITGLNDWLHLADGDD